jgi:hypothetical protein
MLRGGSINHSSLELADLLNTTKIHHGFNTHTQQTSVYTTTATHDD